MIHVVDSSAKRADITNVVWVELSGEEAAILKAVGPKNTKNYAALIRSLVVRTAKAAKT